MGYADNEEIYELVWFGPYRLDELKSEDVEYIKTLSLYTFYEHHPLYGRDVLTYIGKAIRQRIVVRLGQHGLTAEQIHVAGVRKFVSWDESRKANSLAYKDQGFICSLAEEDEPERIISAIEELLIYALWPAGNKRNRLSAKNSGPFRIFNTGLIGSLPPEISGRYSLENAPPPDPN